MSTVERAPDPLVEAIHDGRLYEAASAIARDPAVPATDRDRAERAVAACEHIGRVCEARRLDLVERLRVDGCEVEPSEIAGPRQHHTIELVVADFDAAGRAASLLQRDGFEPWQTWTRGAERSARRFAEELVVGATTDVTTVVRFRWGDARARSPLRRVVTPTAGDWTMVDLPVWLWPAYSIVRPTRLAMERTGLRRRHDDSLGPFLSTPDELVLPLLEFGGLGPDDRVVDIGCGDGRIVVAAAEHAHCRAVGVERSPDLVERARRRAADDGVADLVEIVQGDALAADVDDATLVVMFLSIRVVADLVPAMLARLRTGARLVIHEQSRLPASMQPPPDESVALIADGAVTVAHRWTKR
jgi:hypothetical protein